MKRRQFVSGLAAVPLASAGTHALSDDEPEAPPPAQRRAPWPAQAWADDFRELRYEYHCQRPMRLPEGLCGVLYRNGPALMHLGDTPYRHWLDGDGMVHSFRFTPGGLQHHARLVATRKLVSELQAGRRLAPGFGTSIPGTAVTAYDAMNTANINTLMLGGELLALWEGGAPHALDPVTLATRGPKVWSPQTAMLPFSAHPRTDADGTVWSFGYLPGAGALSLYELDPRGALRRQAFVAAPNADMVHDFAITQRFLVFVLMPYRYTPSGDPSLSFIGHYAWQPGQPGFVLVVDKATLAPVAQVACEPIGLFHLGNAWEVGNTLRLGVVRYADFGDAMGSMADALADARRPWAGSRWTELEVDLAAQQVRMEQPYPGSVEFPRWDLRRTGRPTRYVYLMAASGRQRVFGFDTLRAVDQQTQQLQAYRFGPSWIAEEHVFVPHPRGSAENHGWLVGTAYDWVRRRTAVSVFDAARVEQGPIEQVLLPYGLPLGLHGQFHPS